MVKKIISLMVLMTGSFVYGQTGFGTELVNSSAEVEIASSKKGLLIPRVSLKGKTDTTTIVGLLPYTNSLLVYNEQASTDFPEGFYYWFDNEWRQVVDNANISKALKVIVSLENKLPVTGDGKGQGFNLKSGDATVGGFSETLTKFSIETRKYYVLVKDGSGSIPPTAPDEILVKMEVGDDENVFPIGKAVLGYTFSDNIITKEEFLYTDELGKTDAYELNNVLENIETLTTLRLETNYLTTRNGVEVRVPALIYKDEADVETPIFLDRLFEFNESLTRLELDMTNKLLIYKDEKKESNPIDINQIVKTAWNKSGTINEKGNFGDNIYTSGWVGIGYDTPSTALSAPNEKLRVNGSVTAVNSYYADYVFDAYFNGASSLKYDYKFNNLNTIESFIKENKHLPGITPISELNKSEQGYSFNLSELSIQLLEKTEELYLHTIDQAKEIKSLKTENELLKERLEEIERLIREKLAK